MATAPPSTSSPFDRLPPQNLDAERSVLGSMMLANEVIDELADVLQPDHFYSDAHRRIAQVIFDLYEKTVGGIDPVTVAEELERRNELAEIGGPAYLGEIVETVPHAAHARYYAGIVRDKWTLRTLRQACTDILRDIESTAEAEQPLDLLQKAEQRVFQILELKGSTSSLEMRDILMEAFEAINARWVNNGKLPGLPSGFTDLDAKTTGFHPADLIILAARPSMGKTAFVCNVALSVASAAADDHKQAGGPEGQLAPGGVLLFSLEQSKLELSERFLCMHGQIDGHRLKQGDLTSQERDQVQIAASELSELPIFIDDQGGRSMAEIAAVSRRMRRRYGIGLIVVDYLQLIEPDDRRAPREQQVAQIARRLKYLAKEMNVPVIALAQLNRGVEQREDKRPRLADLRESGAIEQDADLVMFLHRPEAYNPEDRPGEAELIVAKHRNGPTGIVTLTWRAEFLRFADYSPLDEPEGGYFGEGGGF